MGNFIIWSWKSYGISLYLRLGNSGWGYHRILHSSFCTVAFCLGLHVAFDLCESALIVKSRFCLAKSFAPFVLNTRAHPSWLISHGLHITESLTKTVDYLYPITIRYAIVHWIFECSEWHDEIHCFFVKIWIFGC